jgi:uncharacterized glyoxalase superfamily protein PhnB
MKPTPPDWPRMSSAVVYQDAAAAIKWLCEAFGFEVRLKIEGDKGQIEHSELSYGEGLIMAAQEAPRSQHTTMAKTTGQIAAIAPWIWRDMCGG